MTDPELHIGGYPLSGLVRRVRRTADLSQRELAKAARVSRSLIGSIEAARTVPSLPVFQRIVNAATFELCVVDSDGRIVIPLYVWKDVEDGAGRRYPAHLDTILDPEYGEWWADLYGLARPPETFRRSRAYRNYLRAQSQWEVRVAAHRGVPRPQPPREEC